MISFKIQADITKNYAMIIAFWHGTSMQKQTNVCCFVYPEGFSKINIYGKIDQN